MSKKLILIILISMLVLASAGAVVLVFLNKPDNEQDEKPPFMEMIGIGGGGAFFTPMIDPINENNYFVTSDMGGLYYSHNKGASWSRVVKRAVFNTAYMAENGNIFVGGNGLYVSYDSGKTLNLIYPQDVKVTVSRQGWNENLMLAPDYNNGYLKAVTTDGENVYFVTVDWQGELRLITCDYYGKGCTTLYTEQTTYYNPMSDVIVDIVKKDNCVYFATQEKIYGYDLETKLCEDVYVPQGYIYDFKVIDDYFFIVEDLSNATKIYYTEDFITLSDLLQFNTLPNSFTKWGSTYTFDWHFKEITGNSFNSLYLSFSSYANEWYEKSVDGIIKFNGQDFEWVFDSMYKNRNTLSKPDWSYGSHGPFYGITSNPHDDDMCLIANIESVYVAHYKNAEEREVYTCHTVITEKEGKEYFSTNGLDVQTTYFVYEDPFDSEHIIICTTDLGLQNSYDGGKTFNRMEITGDDWSIYNTCYDLYFDTEVEGKIYGIWSSRHDAPYSPSIYDTNEVGKLGVSLDGGKTWDFTYSSGLPSNCIPVKMSAIKKGGNLQIAVATFNKGFYISNDSGKNFISLNTHIADYKGFIWGEDVVINGNTVYCLTSSYYDTEGNLCPSELYEIDLTLNKTTKANLGEVVIARSLNFSKEKGLFVNVIPTFHYEWFEEYGNGLFQNDNGGIYHYSNGELTLYFENEDGIFHSAFSPDGTMYAVDTYGKVFTVSDEGGEIFAQGLFTMLKNVSFSSDGKVVYVTCFGGGTYKFNVGSK